MTAPFRLAHARADHWGSAAKSCLTQLGTLSTADTVGFVYVTEALAADLPSIVTFLRETSRVAHWVGAVAPGICAGGIEYRDGGALAVMVGGLPAAAIRPFAAREAGQFGREHGEWLQRHEPCVALIHADPRHVGVPELVAEAATEAGFLVGGFVSSGEHPTQMADQPVAGGVSGLLLGGEIGLVSGLSQGCVPIGPAHTVTEGWEGVVMTLDGRPAIEVLKEDAGEIIARDLKRAAGYIHVALPVAGSDTGDYVVRSLLGIDVRQGWLAIGERLAPGDRVMFVRRDANTAQADLARMLDDLKARLAGRPVLAGLYISCVARGRYMFGADGNEMGLIAKALGEVPVIGFYANGEISRDRLYGYTGVLVLLTGSGAA